MIFLIQELLWILRIEESTKTQKTIYLKLSFDIHQNIKSIIEKLTLNQNHKHTH